MDECPPSFTSTDHFIEHNPNPGLALDFDPVPAARESQEEPRPAPARIKARRDDRAFVPSCRTRARQRPRSDRDGRMLRVCVRMYFQYAYVGIENIVDLVNKTGNINGLGNEDGNMSYNKY
ncbi:hypothetical protein EVAR_63593_1 [Eumeta japonica]|uniref:Uncharacterized protein n=1 Tax=Eumeta variegata TaxID=151549 RepID=A0A4C1ZLW5_EUMVA|nr:hypothetical protein EVAR_63593_1 [Eumeta japonica]